MTYLEAISNDDDDSECTTYFGPLMMVATGVEILPVSAIQNPSAALTFIVDDGDDTFGDFSDFRTSCRRPQLHLEVGLVLCSLATRKRTSLCNKQCKR